MQSSDEVIQTTEELLKTTKELMTEVGRRIDGLKSIRDQQSKDGLWNHDAYMHGMANGLILAASLFENEEPKFINPPLKYKVDEKSFEDKIMSKIEVIKK